MELKDYIKEFRDTVDQIYGTYLDSTYGLHEIRKNAEKSEEEAKNRHKQWQDSNPQYKNIPFGGSFHGYGRLVKQGSEKKRIHLHQVSFDSLLERNSPGGVNFRLIGNLCLVAIFQYWEDHYRIVIAKCLAKDAKEIKVPLFGELTIIRNSIIHNNGKAISKIKHCNIFNWFEQGELIHLTQEIFGDIVDNLLDCLDQIEANPDQFICPLK